MGDNESKGALNAKRAWACMKVIYNWRIRKRLPRVTKLAQATLPSMFAKYPQEFK